MKRKSKKVKQFLNEIEIICKNIIFLYLMKMDMVLLLLKNIKNLILNGLMTQVLKLNKQ
jgi:hypothetical protein